MRKTLAYRIFFPLKRVLPRPLSNIIRNLATAFLTPVIFSYKSGHFFSSLKMASVSRTGRPLPWYTYSCIDFLKYRDFSSKNVLEFGGGQSTLFWAARTKTVTTFEGDIDWLNRLKKSIPDNVSLHHIFMGSRKDFCSEIRTTLSNQSIKRYDVIIIDGLYRTELIGIALDHLAQDGMLICDNAEGWGFYETLRNSEFKRVDFYGHAPGVHLPHCTAIYFRSECGFFDSSIMIHDAAEDDQQSN